MSASVTTALLRGTDPTLVLVLNLCGTFVFGISGGLAAVRARLDPFGVLVLAAVVCESLAVWPGRSSIGG